MAETYSAGIVTAYGAAVRGGYTGTYEEFCAEQASFAENAEQVAQDREAMETLTEQFSGSTVPAAVQTVQAAGAAQIQAVKSASETEQQQIAAAGAAQKTRVTQAGDDQVDAVEEAGATQVGNVNTAGTTQVNAVQAKGKEVIDSIPDDYSELSGEVSDLKSAFESFESKVFEESSPNFIRLADIPETVEAGLTYSLTDNYLEVSGTTTEAFTKYLPLLQPIPAGNYYFTNFMTFSPGIINGTFNLITTDNQFILLSGQNVTNLAVTIPEGKVVNRLSIYFGANRLETSTYRFCLTDYQLPTPAAYPEDTIELAPTITNLLDEKYDTDAVTPNRAVCWGDSLTDGAPTYSYPSTLQSLITAGGNTITVENGGQGGETSLQIAVRQGSIAIEVNPATIPASGDVTITMANWNGKNIEILTRGGAYVTYNNPHLLLNPVTINGVAGNVLRNSSGDIVFTRTGSGVESQFTRPVKMSVIADADYNLPTDVTIIWAGTNDTLWGIDQTITTIQNMIATLKNEKYIIVGLTAKVHFSDIVDRNFAMANTFGKHFVNVRDYILTYGLSDAGITPTTEDETDIANGEIPRSLRVDSLHFNEAGYTIVANQVYKKGQELGYWN